MQQLDEVVASALAKITEATDNNALEALRVEYFGKKGVFTEQMKALAGLSPEERPAAGQLINQAKEKAQNALNERREALTAAELAQKLAAETIDVSLPDVVLKMVVFIRLPVPLNALSVSLANWALALNMVLKLRMIFITSMR